MNVTTVTRVQASFLHLCSHARVHAHGHASHVPHAWTDGWMDGRTHASTHARARARTHTHTHTHTHIHILTHTKCNQCNLNEFIMMTTFSAISTVPVMSRVSACWCVLAARSFVAVKSRPLCCTTCSNAAVVAVNTGSRSSMSTTCNMFQPEKSPTNERHAGRRRMTNQIR